MDNEKPFVPYVAKTLDDIVSDDPELVEEVKRTEEKRVQKKRKNTPEKEVSKSFTNMKISSDVHAKIMLAKHVLSAQSGKPVSTSEFLSKLLDTALPQVCPEAAEIIRKLH